MKLKVLLAIITGAFALLYFINMGRGIHYSLSASLISLAMMLYFLYLVVEIWEHPAVLERRRAWWKSCKARLQIGWVRCKTGLVWFTDIVAIIAFAIVFSLAILGTAFGIVVIRMGAHLPWWMWSLSVLAFICFVVILDGIWNGLNMSKRLQPYWSKFRGWLARSWRPLVSIAGAIVCIALIGKWLSTLPRSQSGSGGTGSSADTVAKAASSSDNGAISIRSEKSSITLPDKPIGIVNQATGNGTINYGTINYDTSADGKASLGQAAPSSVSASAAAGADAVPGQKKLSATLNAPLLCVGAWAETPIVVPAGGEVDCPNLPSWCHLSTWIYSDDPNAIETFLDDTPYAGPRDNAKDIKFINLSRRPIPITITLTYIGEPAH